MAEAETTSFSCPECGGIRLYKDGQRELNDGSKAQRWLCRQCGYRFSGRHNSSKAYGGSMDRSQICASRMAKNLDTATETKTVVGEIQKTLQDAKGKILELCLHMKRQGYSDETIRLNRIALKVLIDRGANLYDEGSVKDVIARQTWSDNRRRNVINA